MKTLHLNGRKFYILKIRFFKINASIYLHKKKHKSTFITKELTQRQSNLLQVFIQKQKFRKNIKPYRL